MNAAKAAIEYGIVILGNADDGHKHGGKLLSFQVA